MIPTLTLSLPRAPPTLKGLLASRFPQCPPPSRAPSTLPRAPPPLSRAPSSRAPSRAPSLKAPSRLPPSLKGSLLLSQGLPRGAPGPESAEILQISYSLLSLAKFRRKSGFCWFLMPFRWKCGITIETITNLICFEHAISMIFMIFMNFNVLWWNSWKS